jgi:hypothetical protein
MKRVLKVDWANQLAMWRYRPKQYSGRISLFLSSRPLVDTSPDRRMGWADIAGDGIEVHVIPADHNGFLTEPGVGFLGEKLELSISNVQKI